MQTSELGPTSPQALAPEALANDLSLSEYPPIHWVPLGTTVLGLFFYLPLAKIFGLLSFDWGARYFVAHPASVLLSRLIGLSLLVHWVVTWPLTAFIFPSKGRARGQGECLALAVLFAGPPLLSLAVFLARLKSPLDGLEIFLTLFPALLISVIWYLRTERQWILTACLTLTLFIPLFLVSDLLGPIPVLISYASRGPALYWLRVLIPLLALAAALAWPSGRYFQFHAWRREAGMTLIGLFILTFALKILVPVAMALGESSPATTYLSWDWGIVLFPLMVALAASRPRERWRRCLVAALGAELAWSAFSSVHAMVAGEADYWSLSTFALGVLATLLVGNLLIQSMRPTVRQFYTKA